MAYYRLSIVTVKPWPNEDEKEDMARLAYTNGVYCELGPDPDSDETRAFSDGRKAVVSPFDFGGLFSHCLQITATTSQVRGEFKSAAMTVVKAYYGIFRDLPPKPAGATTDPRQAPQRVAMIKERVEKLLDKHTFLRENAGSSKASSPFIQTVAISGNDFVKPLGLHFFHRAIVATIKLACFSTKHREGSRFPGNFSPMPHVTIALAATAVSMTFIPSILHSCVLSSS
jgi:hypothetical protein